MVGDQLLCVLRRGGRRRNRRTLAALCGFIGEREIVCEMDGWVENAADLEAARGEEDRAVGELLEGSEEVGCGGAVRG